MEICKGRLCCKIWWSLEDDNPRVKRPKHKIDETRVQNIILYLKRIDSKVMHFSWWFHWLISKNLYYGSLYKLFLCRLFTNNKKKSWLSACCLFGCLWDYFTLVQARRCGMHLPPVVAPSRLLQEAVAPRLLQPTEGLPIGGFGAAAFSRYSKDHTETIWRLPPLKKPFYCSL